MRASQYFEQMGIRTKLIVIFVAIKVVPLVLLAWYAWQAAQGLSEGVSSRALEMAEAMRVTQQQTGKTANDDAVRALDERSREAIESLTTDLAREVADFLYDRDKDVLRASALEPTDATYRRFITSHTRELYGHDKYVLSDDGKAWVATAPITDENPVRAPLVDNAKGFHTRAPENYGRKFLQPLFLEMTFVDLSGVEKVKVQQGDLLRPGLRDVSRRENTFIKAESYWPAVQKLKPGEIYVSEVIGPYVPTHWIGPYTKARAEELKKPFDPKPLDMRVLRTRSESGFAALCAGLLQWKRAGAWWAM